ncbi:MAG: hypothetical protein R3A11_04160 [Bdellovibrionota bacterium]
MLSQWSSAMGSLEFAMGGLVLFAVLFFCLAVFIFVCPKEKYDNLSKLPLGDQHVGK